MEWLYSHKIKSNIQEEIMVLNVYGPNNKASVPKEELMKLKGEIEKSTVNSWRL